MKKFFIVIAAVFLILAAIIFVILKLENNSYVSEVNIVSPDSQEVIVIREYDYLSNTGANIYLKNGKTFGKDKFLGATTAEGGCYPFSDGNYLIEWGTDFIIVKYFSGTKSEKLEDNTTWKTRELHF